LGRSWLATARTSIAEEFLDYVNVHVDDIKQFPNVNSWLKAGNDGFGL